MIHLILCPQTFLKLPGSSLKCLLSMSYIKPLIKRNVQGGSGGWEYKEEGAQEDKRERERF